MYIQTLLSFITIFIHGSYAAVKMMHMSNNYYHSTNPHAAPAVLHPVSGNENETSSALFRLNPLISGDTVPNVTLQRKYGLTNVVWPDPAAAHLNLNEFLRPGIPLVVAFLPLRAARADVEALSVLEGDIKVMGGQLLAFTNAEKKQLPFRFRSGAHLPLFHDVDNEAAFQFGLYDMAAPLTEWISGVDVDSVGLPAYYVLDAAGKIVFHHIDYGLKTLDFQFAERPFLRQLLTSVYDSSDGRIGVRLKKAVS